MKKKYYRQDTSGRRERHNTRSLLGDDQNWPDTVITAQEHMAIKPVHIIGMSPAEYAMRKKEQPVRPTVRTFTHDDVVIRPIVASITPDPILSMYDMEG